MERDNCFYIGKITRIVGLTGELAIFIDSDNPGAYHNLKSVFVDLDGSLVPFFIENIGLRSKENQANIKFLEINTLQQATKLQGCELYLPLDALPTLTGNQFYFHEVEGFGAVDKKYGSIGTIRKVIDYPGNPVFEILFKNTELLIPVRDEFIEMVDRANKIIYLNSPEGLIDIYLDNNNVESD